MNISTKNVTSKDKNINISSRYDFQNLRHNFWAHTNRSKMQQKLFQNLFTTRSWRSFWKWHGKGTAKAIPKIEKICILYIYREYLLFLQSNASGSFLQKCNNFVEQRLKFSHFEGSIIAWVRLVALDGKRKPNAKKGT